MLIPVLFRVEQPLLDRIEDWRRARPMIPPRAEALRTLLERALDHEPKPAKNTAA